MKTFDKIIAGLGILAFLTIGFVFFQLNAAQQKQDYTAPITTQAISIDNSIMPKGEPRIYGPELGVSYDDVSASDAKKADDTIKKLGVLDTSIRLKEAEKARYINIAKNISCEYCCGTDSIITPTGEAACGCAHSYAMRGVAKYLITKHSTEFTDEQILEELSKWKTLFFPTQMSQKAEALKENGIEVNYINLASNNYRNI